MSTEYRVTVVEEFEVLVSAESEADAWEQVDQGYVVYDAEDLTYRKVTVEEA